MQSAFLIHRDHVEVIVSEQFNLQECKACVDEMITRCKQHSLSRALVNGLTLSEYVSVADRFSLGEYLAATISPKMRIAILTTRKVVTDSKALQNTANNRGAQVISTDSLKDALAFLGVSDA